MNKKQNLNVAPVEAINTIQSYGLVVLVHMIIGSDSDDKSIFQQTAAFINEAHIVFHICHPLAAPPGTRMWYDYKRQGRLISFAHGEADDKTDITTNILPLQMTRAELFHGLADYWDHIYHPKDFVKRAKAFIRNVNYTPKVKQPSLQELWCLRKMLGKVFSFYLFRAGKVHRRAFFKILFSAGRRLAFFMPKIVYIYTFYLIDVKRSAYDAAQIRAHARRELENPGMLVVEPVDIPVAQKIREYAHPLIHAAYNRVREHVTCGELLYRTIIAAMLDYNDRFGETMDTFDAYHKEQIFATCDRALAQAPGNGSGEVLPSDPPPGFVREIIDALDNAVRYRNLRNEAGSTKTKPVPEL